MKIAIVSKLSDNTTALPDLISRYCSEYNIMPKIFRYTDTKTFLEEHKNAPYPIIFLDADEEYTPAMIELVYRIREADARCMPILSTTSGQHAVAAYQARIFDYLVKPYSYERFCDTMDSCKSLLAHFNALCNYIVVKESRRQVKILLSDIIFTDYYNHYVQIHTPERIIRSYLPFPDFSEMLLKYPQYLCCYRNCIINMDHVAKIDNNDFVMDTGDRIPIARRIRSSLRQAFADYSFQRTSLLQFTKPLHTTPPASSVFSVNKNRPPV